MSEPTSDTSDEAPADADRPERPKRAAVVLGSGGARGYAHIGVIGVLEERGYDIVACAGSSMGALVGGLYCAGKLAEFEEWARTLGQIEILRMIDLSLTSSGAIRGDKVFNVVGDLVGELNIEDLSIDFTAVAADLMAQREVWFQEGPLLTALRASSAIPSVFTPITLNGRILVDGGLLNPVPVAPVAAAHAEVVVAITLNGLWPGADRPVAETAAEADEEEWSERLRDRATRWFDSDMLRSVRRYMSPELKESLRNRFGPDYDKDPKIDKIDSEDDVGKFDIMQLSIEAMQAALTRHRLAGYTPDVLIEVPKNAARTLEFHRAGELIDLGRKLAEEALDDYEG